jgi:lipoprotein NlpD
MLKAYARYTTLVILGFFLLMGCQSPYQSPVAEIDEPRFLDSDRIHRVNEGETLYVIAWIYDLDFIHIARVNSLSSPYIIFPGQILNVDPRAQVVQQTRNTATAPASTSTGRNQERLRQTDQSTSQSASQSASQSTRQSSPVQVNPVSVRQGPVNWTWPAQGSIIGRFSQTGVESKGINIGGREGDTVMAAAAGEVVYAGSGLLRYGELVIIKHNDRFLSAYAHNSALLVAEGDRVSRGEKIAELGSTGVDTEMLHFEIRMEGKPVDPLSYLPSRS